MATLTVHLSDRAKLDAERRAAENGFPSIEAYVASLVEQDAATDDQLQALLSHRAASADAGEMDSHDFDAILRESALARARACWMIRRRVGVDDDIAEIALYLLEQAGEPTAMRFIDAVELTLKELALAPRRGSPKRFTDPALIEVRSWWVKGFPNHIIYYLQIRDGINVFAVWHGSRDIERQLAIRALIHYAP